MDGIPESALECLEGLTLKQTLFVLAYLGPANGNATQAARLAGYEQEGIGLRVQGHDNLTNPNIRAAIDRYLEERIMTTDEILSRLADQARSGDFVDQDADGQMVFDAAAAKRSGKLHVVKKIKRKTRRVLGGREIVTTEDLELYDAQAALVHLGKHKLLFTEQIRHTGEVRFTGFEGWTPEEMEEYARTGQRPQPAVGPPVADEE